MDLSFTRSSSMAEHRGGCGRTIHIHTLNLRDVETMSHNAIFETVGRDSRPVIHMSVTLTSSMAGHRGGCGRTIHVSIPPPGKLTASLLSLAHVCTALHCTKADNFRQ